MKEIACQFGEQNRLNGIITEATNTVRSPIALILVTAGLTAKAGPFRLYTRLAREASKIGMIAMRFDLGGIGNSKEIHPGFPLNKRTEWDIKQAADYLEKNYNTSSFVLGGLCSGAEDSLRYALEDQRVTGVFLIDGHAYRTKKWWWMNTFNLRYIIQIFGRILRSIRLFKYIVKDTNELSLEGNSGSLIDYQQMEFEEVNIILQTLIDRNTRLHYIYTLGLSDNFNHKNQFYQMFPNIDFKDLVTVNYLSHMGHVQIFEQDRDEMVKTICDWLNHNFSLTSLIE